MQRVIKDTGRWSEKRKRWSLVKKHLQAEQVDAASITRLLSRLKQRGKWRLLLFLSDLQGLTNPRGSANEELWRDSR